MLLCADETSISIQGKRGYVWVLCNHEEVVFLCTESREGDFLKKLLVNFHSVLVSDFYSLYDSFDCPQQKCLVHLIRDLNEDLLKQGFNEELKSLAHDFAVLLKPMIETIDRFGLKSRFLKRHNRFVGGFYRKLAKSQYKTEVAERYKKRFENNRGTLFTFLKHDGIPWNNNNAEHAIKALALLRKEIGGSSNAVGISEYLVLLSILETCKCQGLDFFNFLRSGEKDIEVFAQSQHKRRRNYQLDT